MQRPDQLLGVKQEKSIGPNAHDLEDTYSVDSSMISKIFTEMRSDVDREQIMKTALLVLNQTAGKVETRKDQGSCACAATAWIDQDNIHGHVANLGDSVAFLITKSPDHVPKFFVSALNTELHDLGNHDEVVAIQNGVGRVKNESVVEGSESRLFKMGGSVAVTRAVGDHTYDEVGLSHMPAVKQHSIYKSFADIGDHDKVYLVVVCDGAMEHLKGRKDMINAYTNELLDICRKSFGQHEMLPDHLAGAIVQRAREKGSQDDVTAVALEVTPHHPKTVCVFDGHGGDHVSKKLSQQFNNVLQESIALQNHLINVLPDAVQRNIILDNMHKCLNNEKVPLPELRELAGVVRFLKNEPNSSTMNITSVLPVIENMVNQQINQAKTMDRPPLVRAKNKGEMMMQAKKGVAAAERPGSLNLNQIHKQENVGESPYTILQQLAFTLMQANIKKGSLLATVRNNITDKGDLTEILDSVTRIKEHNAMHKSGIWNKPDKTFNQVVQLIENICGKNFNSQKAHQDLADIQSHLKVKTPRLE